MLPHSEIVSLLQGNELFADASEEVIEHLAAEVIQVSVEEGKTLINQGHRCGSVYLVADGNFGIFVSGRFNPIAEVGRGRVFGEIGAVSGINATATVTALTDGLVLEIAGSVLHQAMQDAPKMAETILRSLSRYLGQS